MNIKHINLAIGETLLVALSVFIGLLLLQKQTDASLLNAFPHYLLAAMIYSVTTVAIMAGFGLYSRLILLRRQERTPRLILAILLSSLVIAEVSYLLPKTDLGHGPWLIIMITAFTLLLFSRQLSLRLIGEEQLKKRVLVLGAGRKALQFAKTIGDGTAGTVIVGFVHQPGERERLEKDKVLYSVSSLCEYAKTEQIEEIVVAVDDRRNGFPLQQLLACRLCGIDVTDLLHFYERECGQIKLDILDPSWIIFSQGFKQGLFHTRIKQMMDISCSGALLLLAAPLLLLFSCLLYLANGHRVGVLRRDECVGQYGLRFNRLAFNIEAGHWVAKWVNLCNAEYLPQLFNVLRGEMSLIGPAADEASVAELAVNEVPYYNERHMLKPGITGWAKVALAKDFNEQSRTQHLQYDLYYVKNASLFLDFVIFMHILPEGRFKKESTLPNKALLPSMP